jgi:hypothetical protein
VGAVQAAALALAAVEPEARAEAAREVVLGLAVAEARVVEEVRDLAAELVQVGLPSRGNG